MTSSRLNSSEDSDSKKLSFSIEHILNRAGNQESSSNEQDECVVPTNSLSLPCGVFPWLHCTRYCPPKIPSKFLSLLRKYLDYIYACVIRIYINLHILNFFLNNLGLIRNYLLTNKRA